MKQSVSANTKPFLWSAGLISVAMVFASLSLPFSVYSSLNKILILW